MRNTGNRNVLSGLALAAGALVVFGCSGDGGGDGDDANYEIKVKDGDSAEEQANGGFSATNPASIKAFTEKLHPTLKEHCGSCHGVAVSPPFAVDDAGAAHKTVVDFHLAAPTAAPSSRLVTRLSINNHNCWSQCPNDADAMLIAIKEWFDAANITGGGTNLTKVGPVTVDTKQELLIKGGEGGNWVREAENFDAVSDAFEAKDDSTASMGRILARVVPAAGQPVPQGEAKYNFYIPEAESYQLWMKVRDVDQGRGISYRINGGAVRTANYTPTVDDWEWFRVFENTPLKPLARAGILEFSISASGPAVDMIAITSNTTFDRGLIENTGLRFAVEFDLQPLLGKKMKLRMLITGAKDPESYILSSPTLVMEEAAKVKIGGFYVLVNDEFNPQYSTFASLDTTVTETSQLSPRGLVVHKVGETGGLTLGFKSIELLGD